MLRPVLFRRYCDVSNSPNCANHGLTAWRTISVYNEPNERTSPAHERTASISIFNTEWDEFIYFLLCTKTLLTPADSSATQDLASFPVVHELLEAFPFGNLLRGDVVAPGGLVQSHVLANHTDTSDWITSMTMHCSENSVLQKALIRKCFRNTAFPM